MARNVQSRRDFLASAAASAAASAGVTPSIAHAQKGNEVMGASSDLDYRTTTELTGLLAARKVSAVELLERSVARIEARDKAVNAVVVRDFDRARAAAKAADAALAKRRARSAAGRADDRQGIL